MLRASWPGITMGQLARHHHRSPELLSDEQIQGYLLHLLQERHRRRSTVNITVCAMRFPVCNVLGQAERRPQIPLGRQPQRLPEVLSRAEVAALLGAPMSMTARTFLMTAYASGLRLSALCSLRGCDIDSAPDRMCMQVARPRPTEHDQPLLAHGTAWPRRGRRRVGVAVAIAQGAAVAATTIITTITAVPTLSLAHP